MRTRLPWEPHGCLGRVGMQRLTRRPNSQLRLAPSVHAVLVDLIGELKAKSINLKAFCRQARLLLGPSGPAILNATVKALQV